MIWKRAAPSTTLAPRRPGLASAPDVGASENARVSASNTTRNRFTARSFSPACFPGRHFATFFSPTQLGTAACQNALVAASGRKPGVVAVARAAGVSPSTVSNAFNRPERLTPALRERVLRVAAELGYGGPDPAARILRRGRAGAVAVVLGRLIADALGDPATIQFLTGVADPTDRQQLALVLVPEMPYRDVPEGPAVRNAAADGLIVFSLPGDDPIITAVLHRSLPTVIVDSPTPSDVRAFPGGRRPGLDFLGI